MSALRMIAVGNVSTVYEQYIKPSSVNARLESLPVSSILAGVISSCLRQQAVRFSLVKFVNIWLYKG